MSSKLYTETIPGNLFEATTYINKRGWALNLIQMEVVGDYTIAVFRMPREQVHNIRRLDRSYVMPPDHDDCETGELSYGYVAGAKP